ncbi:Peptidoglycan-binding LysM domain-containing protein [Rhynchospora pubera]|uniref:Peptidoglycan-binding LysM domain-containing protein n=2 Tax=Rhynchospora pubera TaxID=906938 RepID=A0AAV8H337_9POAL|nr:Peptidoglycan-binding LysM domain-containing protein [Rhynchospora pubera]
MSEKFTHCSLYINKKKIPLLKAHVPFFPRNSFKTSQKIKPRLSLSPMAVHRKATARHSFLTLVDAATWPCALIVITLILFCSMRDEPVEGAVMRGSKLGERPCDELYVVTEGETLHSISDKCHDPFILEENPHIHDPDDVFPGLVIKITQINKAKDGKTNGL